MKVLRTLRFAVVGWIAGMLAMGLLSLVWPAIFPAVVNLQHYPFLIPPNPQFPVVALIGLILASPGALVGGLVGSRIPREGGRTEQTIMAAIVGILLSVPCGCYALWIFTGS